MPLRATPAIVIGGHNLGEAAFQSVPHFHIHVVPRWHRDGKRLT